MMCNRRPDARRVVSDPVAFPLQFVGAMSNTNSVLVLALAGTVGVIAAAGPSITGAIALGVAGGLIGGLASRVFRSAAVR